MLAYKAPVCQKTSEAPNSNARMVANKTYIWHNTQISKTFARRKKWNHKKTGTKKLSHTSHSDRSVSNDVLKAVYQSGVPTVECCRHDVFLVDVDIKAGEQLVTFHFNAVTSEITESIHCVSVQRLCASQQMFSAPAPKRLANYASTLYFVWKTKWICIYEHSICLNNLRCALFIHLRLLVLYVFKDLMVKK